MSIIISGDTHGDFARFYDCHFKENDTLIILGDAGINIYENTRYWYKMVAIAKNIKCNVFCIRGNHERRPESFSCYNLVDTPYGEKAWVNKAFPRVFFAQDGKSYTIEGHQFFVIGGAYSVDKPYRISRNLFWEKQEQLSAAERKNIDETLANMNYKVEYVLSHTCPLSFQPREMFLPGIDQSTVDTSMEEWLETVEQKLDYKMWFFGHYHADKVINDKALMLFEGIYTI